MIQLIELLAIIVKTVLYYWALTVVVPLTPLVLENPWHYIAAAFLLSVISTSTAVTLKDYR